MATDEAAIDLREDGAGAAGSHFPQVIRPRDDAALAETPGSDAAGWD